VRGNRSQLNCQFTELGGTQALRARNACTKYAVETYTGVAILTKVVLRRFTSLLTWESFCNMQQFEGNIFKNVSLLLHNVTHTGRSSSRVRATVHNIGHASIYDSIHATVVIHINAPCTRLCSLGNMPASEKQNVQSHCKFVIIPDGSINHAVNILNHCQASARSMRKKVSHLPLCNCRHLMYSRLRLAWSQRVDSSCTSLFRCSASTCP
jgi:hypothetical protein